MDLKLWVEMARASISQGMDPSSVFDGYAETLGEERAQEVQAEVERLAKEVKYLKEPRTLADRRIRDWYTGPMDTHRFWPALKRHLTDEKGWGRDVVDSIDHASSKIVGLLQPPGVGAFCTRGLVLGHVQSGKTANFTAVISKSADVNYRFFIVLSGIHNALRAQTQRRLDRELTHLNPDSWIALTDTEYDFGHLPIAPDSLLTEQAHQRVFAVVKKNSARLQRLKRWLDSANPTILKSCPIMIIDDEADQASLNAAKYDAERTRINELIVGILELLPKHAYLGYTATPFANVLVDPGPIEDLYPRDFIVDLPRPDAYFGPERIFGRHPLEYADDDEPDDGVDMIRRVADDEVPHLRPIRRSDRDTYEPALVASLERAIRYFWLATAARSVREQGEEHSSMLVHTSMLTAVHDAFEPVVTEFKASVIEKLREGEQAEVERFRDVWSNEWDRVPEDPDHARNGFDDLLPHLAGVVSDTLICIENNRSMSRLDYTDEYRIRIVIGGNTLSRGLTLEGLVVSYFVRSAGAYDTLLQMGRWFGYRTGYSDLPRIWMTSELEGFFRDLALVEAEIRRDIERYEDQGLTPSELAVRIRAHPTLAVTSSLKMRAAKEVAHSYSGDRPQTILFDHKDRQIVAANQAAARRLLRKLNAEYGPPESKGSSKLFRGANANDILTFFRDFRFHGENKRLQSDLLLDYVKRHLEQNRLTNWSVGVIGKGGSDARSMDLGLNEESPLIQRSRLKEPERPHAYVGAIMSPGDQHLDLAEGEKRTETDGLLLIYPIDMDSRPRAGAKKRVALDAVDHVIGVAVVFPEFAPERDSPTYVSVDLPAIDPDTIDEQEDLPLDEEEVEDLVDE